MGRVRVQTGLVATALVFAISASAQGATQLGQSPPSVGGAAGCGNQNASIVQITVDPASGVTYTVPAGGGVITSWATTVLDNEVDIALRAFEGDPAGTAFTPVAESAMETVVAGETPSFPTQIPVSGGEMIGVHIFPGSSAAGCIYVGTGDADDVAGLASSPDAMPVGQEETHIRLDGWRLNVEATLEADADNDGFGDETQDQCPTDATKQVLECDPPETTITKDAPKKTSKQKVKFKFVSDEAGSTFECKADKKPFKPCNSPRKVKRLDEGKHKFKVRAIDPAGNVDPSPAKDKFKVVE